jgi:hypothetical protein
MAASPIQLSDGYLTTILANKAILRNFPGVVSVSQGLKHAGCQSCGARSAAVALQYQRLREYIASLPSDKLKELKTMLGVGDRQFATFIGTGRSSRKVLI